MKRIILIILCMFFVIWIAGVEFSRADEVDDFLDEMEIMQEEESIFFEEAAAVEEAEAELFIEDELVIDEFQEPEGPAILYKFEIGPEFSIFHYEEPPVSVEWDADLYGVFAAITGRRQDYPIIGRGEIRFLSGRGDYDGYLNTGAAWTDEGDDYIFELRCLAGRDFNIGASTLTPFFGFGYRYWNDNLESQYAYEREVKYRYSPIGVQTASPLGRGWIWGIRAEYDIFWSGTVNTHLSDVSPNYGDLKNDQDGGFGARGSVYLERKLKQELSFLIEPFVRYWDIDKSNNADLTWAGSIVGYGYEPANKTVEYGLKVSLIW